jgi:hypothetical protein
MDNINYYKAVDKAISANEEICQQYQTDFCHKIVNDKSEPEDTRIAEIERLWHRARMDANAAYSQLTEDLISSIDESEVIESKKENTSKRG